VNIPQRVAFNTTVQLVARLGAIALALISFALVTRYLGVEGFGEYALVLAFLALLVPISDLGLTAIGVRELAAHRDEEETLVGDLLGVRIVVALTAALLLVAISPLFPYSDRVEGGLRLAAIGLFALVLSGLPLIVFQSRERLELSALVDFVTAAATLLFVVMATQADLGFNALILATVLAGFAAGAVGFVFASRLVRLRPRFDRARARVLLAAALPVGVFLMFSVAQLRIDTVMLSLLKEVDDVGVYGAAYRFLEQALFFPGLFMAAVYPILAAQVANRDPGLQLAIDKSLTFLLATAIPLAAGSVVLAPDIIRLLAGEDFAESVEPMRILAFAAVFAFTTALFSSLLVLLEQQRRLLVLVVAAFVLNVTLNLILIPPFSYIGAASASVATQAFFGVSLAVAALRQGHLSLHLAQLPRILLATAAMCVLLWLTSSLPFGVTVVAGLVSYAAMSYLLGIVTRADLDLLRARRASVSEL
jgi:O-antigen/teichoic acid export membrane protein